MRIYFSRKRERDVSWGLTEIEHCCRSGEVVSPGALPTALPKLQSTMKCNRAYGYVLAEQESEYVELSMPVMREFIVAPWVMVSITLSSTKL